MSSTGASARVFLLLFLFVSRASCPRVALLFMLFFNLKFKITNLINAPKLVGIAADKNNGNAHQLWDVVKFSSRNFLNNRQLVNPAFPY
ncbi:MAG: hypothetical protein EHM48_03475 [Planctomycetaceae bacterium]|nr:MAG: hypothetical protein EHM48_03475 [Planctomycetaceae bacterium]